MQITDLKPFLIEALNKKGITEFSEVQQTIPESLQGKDLFIQSPTGSGKTLSYLLPILQTIEVQTKKTHYPYALIMVPTRELALQVTQVIRSLLEKKEGIRTATLIGGVDIQKQIRSFSHGADIIVGVPSRIQDHLRRHTLKTKNIQRIILDEADEMLSLGFQEDVLSILSQIPSTQISLYSATSNSNVKALANTILKEPVEYNFLTSTLLKQDIHFKWYAPKPNEKLKVLESQLSNTQTLLFCNTKKTVDFVYEYLCKKHYPVNRLYSGLPPKERKQILQDFKDKKYTILCTTDVLSRGIDIIEVELVINYDYPDQDVVFTHRIGRTARSNHNGTCITLLSRNQVNRIQEIENIIHEPIRITYK